MNTDTATANKSWTRSEIEVALREILVDALAVDEAKVVSEASLVNDLGAESIDFLDIGFRVQQTFGVEFLPAKAIQEQALSWRNLEDLSKIIQERYGLCVAPEEIRQFHTVGLPKVLGWIQEKKGIVIQNGEAESLAGELADRLTQVLESVGLTPSVEDRERIATLLLENLNSQKILERMVRLFSVGALVDFITAR
ncbi:MAG: acyl carrier protein, partial [Nitrososphaerales archaeon]